MLVLFDIDGTLLVGSHDAHFAAMRRALAGVFDRVVREDDGIEKSGRTDIEIARDVAAFHGMDASTFASHRDELADAWAAALDELDSDFTRMVPPGTADVLTTLADEAAVLTLVTGNLRPLAERKLRSAGLLDLLVPDVGAYGSDFEDRLMLPPLARRRAGGATGPWSREDTVLVGDTPRDIACARADGIRCIAVMTGGFDADELAGADARVDDVAQLRAVIERVG